MAAGTLALGPSTAMHDSQREDNEFVVEGMEWLVSVVEPVPLRGPQARIVDETSLPLGPSGVRSLEIEVVLSSSGDFVSHD